MMRKWIDLVEETGPRLEAAFKQHGMMNIRPFSGWLIHFTSIADAITISRDGFTKGSPISSTLNMTSGSSYAAPGINFAYDANDGYSISTLSETTMSLSADGAVMFKSHGVAMTHYDGWDQVAFWGKDVSRPIYAMQLTVTDDEDHYNFDLEPHEREWKIVAKDGTVIGGPVGELFDVMQAIEHGL